MNLLALDLGTHTGYAYNIGDTLKLGTWDLATKKEITAQRKTRMDRRFDIRISRLFDYVERIVYDSEVPMRCVVWEDVQFSSTTMQTQLWSSLRTAVWLAARGDSTLECVNVSTLKKFTTGHGGADKDAMAKWLHSVMPERLALAKDGTVTDKTTGITLDDNAIDALAVWRWGQATLGRL
jgi:hypothetical protein